MKESFNVTGMTCAACQANVTKAVAKLDGVQNVDVSLLGNSMKVEYDKNKVNVDQICQAVTNIGYGAMPKNAQGSKRSGFRDEWQSRQQRFEKEQKAARQRLISSVVLMIPLMIVAMGEMLHLPMPSILSGMENMMVNVLVQLILATIIMIIQKQFYIKGFKALWKLAPNMDSLVAVGSSAAYLFALANTFVMAYSLGRMDMDTAHHAMMSGMYYDSAAMIVSLVSIGKYLESRSKARTSDALGKLVDLAPKQANVIRDGMEVSIASEEVVAGDIVVIRPGQSIPVDGKVLEGTGYVDQAAITGESIPVVKQKGDAVMSATVNQNGTFRFMAEKVGDDTTLAQIIRLVDDAGNSKAPIARVADTVAGYFVPAVIGIALLTFVIWMLVSHNFTFALTNAVSVLVISCPCALGLATPVAIMVGTGKAAEYGILIKSAESLENLHHMDTIVLDKTGTITEGRTTVQNIKVYGTMSEDDFLSLAASVESGSLHPLAQAIIDRAKEKGLAVKSVTDFTDVPGRGIHAVIDGRTYYAGNRSFMEESNIRCDNGSEDADQFAQQGKTPLYFSDDNQLLGLIAVADTVRSSSQKAIDAFRQKQMHVVMLTGDNEQTAKAIAKTMHIDEVISDVLPTDKESKIRSLQEAGRKVIMVGDGINDAPALMRADIGMAIGAGTDIAMDSADIILMKDSLLDVNTAIDLSHKVIRNIHMNLFWAFFYNIIGIPIAAGLFYPVFGWQLSPMLGAAAMSLSSVCVCTNALRLRFFRPAVEQEQTVSKEQEPVPSKEERSIRKEMSIEGMMCEHCQNRVQKALEAVDGITDVTVNLENKKATFHVIDSVEEKTWKQAVIDAGYTPVEPAIYVEKEMKIEGMMCPHCQNRVQKALSDVEGVKDVHVDLDEKKASFQVSETVTDQQLIEAVEKAGYQPVEIINRKEKAPMSKTMKVDGMMCAHCQAHVQKALSDVEGVSNVVVSLEDKQATFDVADTVSDDVLKKAVEDAGYTPVSIA